MPDAQEAASFLKGSTRDADALYEHLTKVMLELVKETPADAFDMFEALSVKVKRETAAGAALNQEEAEAEEAEAGAGAEAEVVVAATVLPALQATLDLIQPPKKVPTGEEDEPEEEEEPEKLPIPDVMAELSLLQGAGVGLGEEEAFRLMLSMQTLTTTKELANVRFWGKVLGTQRDYYIVEARLEEYPEPEEGKEAPPKQEPMGSGCNECIYFASNSPELAWVSLNPVQPEHIIAARAMRRYFTGDLSAPVLGFPRFPWGEAAYLRTQIARIAAATVLAPAGQFLVEGEEDEEQTVADNEEWGGVNVLQQEDGTKWLHNRPGIMTEGRSTPWTDPEKEEEEEEDEEEMSEARKAQLAAIEKPRKKLVPIAEDTMGKGTLGAGSSEPADPCWTFRTQPNQYDKFAVSCAQSLQWPGALALARGKTVLNFYTGWGLPHGPFAYQPPQPPAFEAEFTFEDAALKLVEETDVMPPDGAPIEDPPEGEEEEDDEKEEKEGGEDAEGEGDDE